ncbi:MAG: sulfatase-like hydrolase/transferase [Lysobacter sp.]|nr:sulfatase-like hydrolase/transferase [Lysobacter sp.]
MAQGTTTGMGQGQGTQDGDGTHHVADAIDAVQGVRDARPNILMILVDQLYYPEHGYGDAGFANGIKQVLNFVGDIDPATNPYAKHFPGFCKLREYATVFTDHTIAESACIPSRASIMTGQYGPRTGVTQTDGLFKSGDASNFPWLRHDGTPTAGDWFRQLGYSTHYFGKWHVSEPPNHTLQEYGFGDWELSWPEPHGASINNLGTFRDYQFADLACSFLRGRALGVPYNRALSQQGMDAPLDPRQPQVPPFFAVVSFTNPHDIATYPTLPRGLQPQWPAPDNASIAVREPPSPVGPGGSVPVPPQGTVSTTPTEGTFQVPMNPTGLPQDCATASPTQDEDLLTSNKPRAQYDTSYKVALGLAAKTGLSIGQGMGGDAQTVLQNAVKATLGIAIPFQLQKDPDGAAVGFLQYYAYMISMVDRHILRVLETLEQSGLRKDTIVVFASDHGEYGAAHGMQIEKWHGAYQEVVHVPFLVSAPRFNSVRDVPRVVTAQTSHIDILPTLLKLAHATDAHIEHARRELSKTHAAGPLPGADLKPLLRSEQRIVSGPVIGPDGQPRSGVLFVTDDMITEPLPHDADPHNLQSWQQYAVYAATVDLLRTPPAEGESRPYVPALSPGAVPQPAHVRALRSGQWKLVRYCDPWSERPVPDQWELYDLANDPIEATNLLVHDAAFPTVIPAITDPTARAQLESTARDLRAELQRQEAALLSPYPSAHPTASATSRIEAG